MSTDADLQRDAQWAATPESAAAVAAEEMRKDLHTCLPGIVQSFDPATQTAVVVPAIKRIFVEQGAMDLPPCVDVPVHFPAGGSFVLTFPVAAGDECILVFGERSIDSWWDRGGQQEPGEHRFHDLSDAFALVGVSSRPRFLSDVSTSATELRHRDGSVKVSVDSSGVVLGGDGVGIAAAKPLLRLSTLVATWLSAVGTATGAGPFPTDGITTLVKGK